LSAEALPGTLTDLLDRAVALHGPAPFIGVRTSRARERTLTFAEFGVAVERAAARLAAAVPPGARVILQGSPGPTVAAALFAAARAGVVLVPLDARMTPEAVDRICALTEPSALLVGSGATIDAVAVPRVAALPVLDLDDLIDPVEATVAEALRARAEAGPDDPVEVLCTSGSTGSPKGVTVTQRMLLASTTRCLDTIPPATHRFVSILPLSHIMEQVAGLIYAVAVGAEVEYVATLRPDLIAVAIREHRATALVLVPQVLDLLFRAIEREADRTGSGASFRRAMRIAPWLPVAARRRLFARVHAALGGELRLVLSSAAHLPVALQRQWEALGVEIVQGYGSTEAGLVTTNFPGKTPAGRIGWTLPPTEIRLEPDGEIVVRGPSVFGAYWHDPEATRAVFTPDGFYRTGDIGEIDASGAVRLVGRTRAMIVLPNGLNVHPEDVEGALGVAGLAEPVVYEAGPGRIAVAVRSGSAMGTPVEDEPAAIGAAVRAANRRLALHQRVEGWAHYPDADFPRTHTLKIQRDPVGSRMLGIALVRVAAEAPAS
jgi:long-chain acyl-CoA synthetase